MDHDQSGNGWDRRDRLLRVLAAVTFVLFFQAFMVAPLISRLARVFDMTQPLLAGIVTDLSPKRGLAMGLNVFTLFTGFGLGSLVFSGVLQYGLGAAYTVFGAVALAAALLAIPLFRTEGMPKRECEQAGCSRLHAVTSRFTGLLMQGM